MSAVSGNAERNLWVSMCLRPRATIQHIVDTDPERQVMLIAALAGVVYALTHPLTLQARAWLGFPKYLFVALPFGATAGVLGILLAGALYQWTGRWIGGQASAVQLRAATAWGQVPMLIGGGLLWVVSLVALHGQAVVDDAWVQEHAGAVRAVVAANLVNVIASIWATVTWVAALAQVQRFSAWRAILNVILATLVIVAAVLPAYLVLKIGLSPRAG